MEDAVEITKCAFQAYVDSDRNAIEAVISDDFHFTSPLDNRLDRKTYFERCWPNNEHMSEVRYVHTASAGAHAWVMYDAVTPEKTFRNTEMYTVRNGKLVEALVFFGWEVPHKASEGGSVDEDNAESD